jgi:hypothetical protein
VDEYPRRRRLQPQEPKGGGGIPILPLVVLVIFAGLLLGGLLAKVFGGGFGASSATPAPSFTPLPSAGPTATFAARATPSFGSPSPSASASSRPSASPTTRPTARATATPKPSVIYVTPGPKTTASAPAAPIAPTAAPTQVPVEAPAPVATPTPAPQPAASQVLITGAVSGAHAASIVRAYVGAVSRGEESTAAGYLAHGLPNETFLTKGSKITDLETSANGGGSFTVTATISTAGGTYSETFTVQNGPYGMQITDHVATAN